MNKNEKKLNDLFYTIFKIPKNKEKKNLSNENVEKWDSLNHISLILAIESKFGIKIVPEDDVSINLTQNEVAEEFNVREFRYEPPCVSET